MVKYKKKAIVITAIKNTGFNDLCIKDFVAKSDRKFYFKSSGEITIKTLEGNMTADIGDYIIKGIKGEFYPCKPDIFEATYDKVSDTFDFSQALILLKKGERVARKGWNGKGQFVFLVQGSKFKVNRPPLNEFYEEGTEITYQPHIDIKTAQDTVVPWLASQGDLLAEDWVTVDA